MFFRKTILLILILWSAARIHASGSGGYGGAYVSLQGTYGKATPITSSSPDYETARATATFIALIFNIGADLQIPTINNPIAPSHAQVAHLAYGFSFGKILWFQWLTSGHLRTTFNWFHWARNKFDMLPEKQYFPDSIGISISYDHPWRAEEFSRLNIGIALSLQ